MSPLFGRIRWRLTRWNLLVLGLSLVLLCAAVYVSFSHMLMTEVDDSLHDQAREIAGSLHDPGDSARLLQAEGYEGGRFAVVFGPSGQVLANPQRVDTAALALRFPLSVSARIESRALHGEPVRLYLTRLTQESWRGSTLLVGQSLQPRLTALHRLLLVMLVAGGAVLALSVAGAWFLASKALEPIQESFRRQREFTADASHELRTPLMVLRSASDLLNQHRAEPLEANGELFDDIREEIPRLERLVADLLTLARSDLHELALAVGEVDLAALANEAVRRVTPLARERDMELELNVASPLLVEGDPDRLHQVLLILLDNALHHSSPGGRISVAVGRQAGQARIEVADRGEGIPAEHLPRVFDRFYRASRSRERSGGAGLGLAIARALVEAHGGSLALTSTHGLGTTAIILLPAGETHDAWPLRARPRVESAE